MPTVVPTTTTVVESTSTRKRAAVVAPMIAGDRPPLVEQSLPVHPSIDPLTIGVGAIAVDRRLSVKQLLPVQPSTEISAQQPLCTNINYVHTLSLWHPFFTLHYLFMFIRVEPCAMFQTHFVRYVAVQKTITSDSSKITMPRNVDCSHTLVKL